MVRKSGVDRLIMVNIPWCTRVKTHHPNGGWEWDFWTTNSILCFWESKWEVWDFNVEVNFKNYLKTLRCWKLQLSVSCPPLRGQCLHGRSLAIWTCCLEAVKTEASFFFWRITSWWFQIFIVSPGSLGKWSNLTKIFQLGWNPQPD